MKHRQLPLVGAALLVMYGTAAAAPNDYRLASPFLVVRFDPQSFDLRVMDRAAKTTWRTRRGPRSDVEAAVMGRAVSFDLTGARVSPPRAISEGGFHGWEAEVEAAHQEAQVRFGLQVTLAGDCAKLRVSILPASEETGELAWLRYPRPFAISRSEADYIVAPHFQGILAPGNWEDEFDVAAPLASSVYTMPWYGARSGRSSLVAIVETDADGWLHMHNPSGGPPTVNALWQASAGNVKTPRTVTYEFTSDGNYVVMAKRYRDYSRRVSGRFRLLADKRAELPQTERLIGAPRVQYPVMFYRKTFQGRVLVPPETWLSNTFEDLCARVRSLAEAGMSKLVVHVDGWGQRGYDNLHPDVLPPCEKAGGYEGLKALSEECARHGFILELHDNYHDYYTDAPSFSERLTIKDAAGMSPRRNYWDGGEQSVLCATQAPGFVRRNLDLLAEHGVRPGGIYFDVFDAVPPSECFDESHPMTPSESLQWRGRCLDEATSRGMTAASEAGADWAVPHSTHTNSVAVGGFGHGVAVPLYNLVYHDAAYVYGYYNGGASELSCVLHGFAPTLRDGVVWPRWLEAARTVAEFSAALANREMLSHRYVGPNYKVQEALYAGGVTVVCDSERMTWRVTGLPGWDEAEHPTRPFAFSFRCRIRDVHVHGDRVRLTFEWKTTEPLPESKRAFVHFIHPQVARSGGIVFGLDHDLPLTADQWQVGEAIMDGPHEVTVPASAPPGDYRINLGLLSVDRTALPERLPHAWEGDAEDGWSIGRIRVTELPDGCTIEYVPPDD